MDAKEAGTRLSVVSDDITHTLGWLEVNKQQTDSLLRERLELETDLQELQRHEAWLASKAGEQRPANPPAIQANGLTTTRASTKRVHHAEAIEHVLKESVKPLKIQEILGALDAVGHPLPTAENIRFNTVYSVMRRRDDLFRKFPVRRWGLRNHTYPPGYEDEYQQWLRSSGETEDGASTNESDDSDEE